MTFATLEFKVKAILLASRKGKNSGTVLGAAAAARALGVKDQTVREWVRQSPIFLQKAREAGIDVESMEESINGMVVDISQRKSNGSPNLKPEHEMELKEWVISMLESNEGGGGRSRVNYMLVIEQARKLDSNFMSDQLGGEHPTKEQQSAFRHRARVWFNRFLHRHHISVSKTGRSRAGGNRMSRRFDSAFKIRALEMSRELVEGGRGPNGTRGCQATARELHITPSAIW